jgi:hypothetical protein
MTSISSYSAATWLPSVVAQQDSNNWISQNLDASGGLGLPRSAALQDFINTGTAVANTFATAQQNQAQGLAELSVRAGTNRLKNELGKKIAEMADATAQSSIPAAPSEITLADGSILNLAKNTFTLSGGGVLDITSGLKAIGAVVDVTA